MVKSLVALAFVALNLAICAFLQGCGSETTTAAPAAATCDMTAVTSCAQTASTSSTDPCQISSATIECYSSCCTYAEAQTALDAAVSAAAAIPNCNLVSPCA
ncbi:unnamed protein product [Cladocopium goreaui]|uniref:Uncharacterized protein n=1 Tax=Cladocopium goreaui TaxID=2562237 RepID=A0A9P1FR36_9DINO|nr:unnamed protein product [Cladocopium goreaui]